MTLCGAASISIAKMSTFRQTPLTCSGHTRPVVDLDFSDITQHGYFMISACKGSVCQIIGKNNFVKTVLCANDLSGHVTIDDNIDEYLASLTRFNKIAIQGTPQMAVDKEAISLSRVYLNTILRVIFTLAGLNY